MLFARRSDASFNFGISRDGVDEHLVQIPFLFRNIIPPSKVLDLGCHGSPVPLQLAAMRYNVTCIDYSDYGKRHPNLKFIHGDFDSHNFGKERFDVAIVMNAVEHFGLQYYRADEPRDKHADIKAMTKVKELVRPGGQLIFSAKYGVPDTVSVSGKPFTRVYDDKSLEVILSSFKVDTTEYYLITDRSSIRQVPKEEAAGCRYYNNSGTYAFVCVAATKL